MSQFEDDVSTRELHMVALRNGTLYHSMANNFGTVMRDGGAGPAFNRFRTVSTWSATGRAMGSGFGPISDVAIVARPRALHVFFVDEMNGRYRLWHAVRFSAGGGSWRFAEDVMFLNGASNAGAGTHFPFRIAAGLCAQAEKPQETELVYTLWSDALETIWAGRIVSTPQQWLPTMNSSFSPVFDVSRSFPRSNDSTREHTIHSMSIGTRPFRDEARAPSP
jgi:hypothetical protein